MPHRYGFSRTLTVAYFWSLFRANADFRIHVEELKGQYMKAGRQEKYLLSMQIVDRIYSKGGRFLILKDGSSNTWIEMAKERAREKAAQAMRENRTGRTKTPAQIMQMKRNLAKLAKTSQTINGVVLDCEKSAKRPPTKRSVVRVKKKTGTDGSKQHKTNNKREESQPSKRRKNRKSNGSLWKKPGSILSFYNFEDDCAICYDGGDLLVCDGGDNEARGCGRSFHLRCINHDTLPGDDWICQECTKRELNIDVGLEGYEFIGAAESEATKVSQVSEITLPFSALTTRKKDHDSASEDSFGHQDIAGGRRPRERATFYYDPSQDNQSTDYFSSKLTRGHQPSEQCYGSYAVPTHHLMMQNPDNENIFSYKPEAWFCDYMNGGTDSTSAPSNQACFENLFRKLVQYKEVHGHCAIPPSSDSPQPWWSKEERELARLADWASVQRSIGRGIRKGTRQASEEEKSRICRLEQLGFVFDFEEWHWNKRYNELVEFHGRETQPESDGRASAIDFSKSLGLALWVKEQRGLYTDGILGKINRMREDRVRKFEKLGYDWVKQVQELLEQSPVGCTAIPGVTECPNAEDRESMYGMNPPTLSST